MINTFNTIPQKKYVIAKELKGPVLIAKIRNPIIIDIPKDFNRVLLYS